MPDVFTVLGDDHRKVLATLDALEAATTHASSKAELITQLVIDESRHEAIEELYFWPTVQERAELGDVLAQRAIDQEQMAKQMLDGLEGTSGVERDRLVQQFAAAAREHIAYEQDEVWTRLRPKLSAMEAEELGARLTEAKAKAPTRPHPHTPPSPTVLRTAGPVAAAVDKVRDAIRGRG